MNVKKNVKTLEPLYIAEENGKLYSLFATEYGSHLD